MNLQRAHPSGYPQHLYTDDNAGEGAFQAEGDWIMANGIGWENCSTWSPWLSIATGNA